MSYHWCSIKNNRTETKTDWGGGGVYINTDGSLRIDSASITNNTAKGLGGGVSGCPHAKIGIGKLTNGAAVFNNKAEGSNFPNSTVLWFNMPNSVVSSSKKAPSGDFLVAGLSDDDMKWMSELSSNQNRIAKDAEGN